MDLVNYIYEYLQEWEIIIPIKYNAAVVNGDVHNSWLHFDIDEDIVLSEYEDCAVVDDHKIKSKAVIRNNGDGEVKP